jgi:uncharacterized damage-inducible protein DinB
MFSIKEMLCGVLILIAGISYAEQPAFVKEFLGQADFVEGRLTQLAEEMPQDKYSWRPGDGVRSVGEAYIHVAFGNYLWVTMCGGKVPEDAGFVADFSKVHDWDTQTTDKAEIIAIMKKSFDALKETVKDFTQEELDNKEIEFFGMKFSLRNFLVSGLNHSHEHLGQSIAYARMNGVTPPWSKGQE